MSRRQWVIESRYGRDYGWYVEVDGRVVAALVAPRPAGESCDSYRLEPLTADPAEMASLYTDAFWDQPAGLGFRNRWLGAVAPDAAPCGPAGATLRQTGRLVLRGLYLPRPCSP